MFKKRKRLGEYPACDHLNIALIKLLENADENRVAICDEAWRFQFLPIIKKEG